MSGPASTDPAASPAPAPPPVAAPIAGARPPGDDQIKQDFASVRAKAAQPDALAALNARYTQPAAPPATAAPLVPPIDPNQPVGERVVQAAETAAPGAPAGFFGRLAQAGASGAVQSLKDLASTEAAVTGGKQAGAAPPADYEKGFEWSDLAHPEAALDKAVYQIAHGAPVLAAGVGGGMAGGALGSAIGPEGTAAGSIAGGALGAGAMQAAQSLGPYYAAALRANPQDPAAAWDQALKQAGASGVFSAAGWALFGLKPFAGAVQNLTFQAFGVQPGVAAAGKVADNAVSGQPLGQGVGQAAAGAAVMTAPMMGAHAAVGGLAQPGEASPPEGAPAGAEASAPAPGAPGASEAVPAAATGAPAADAAVAPSDGVVTDGDLWRVPPDQLQTMLQERQGGDKDNLVKALGEAGAAEWTKLERASNGSGPGRDVASARLDEIESGLDDRQKALIYGIGDTRPQADDIKAVLDAHGNRTDDPLDAAYSAALAIRKGGTAAEILAVPDGGGTVRAQAAYVQLRNAYEDMAASGVPSDEVQKTVVNALVQRGGWGEADAQEIVGSFEADAKKAMPGQPGAALSALPAADAATGVTAEAPLPKDAAPPAPEQKPDPLPIGDAKAPPTEIDDGTIKNALDYLDGREGSNPVKVNLAYIGTDNISQTLATISRQLPGQGVQSHEATTSLALSLGMQPEQLLAGYKGQQLDAAQTTAMRLMLDSSAQQLVQFATAATDPNTGSPAAMAQFLKAFATHQGIQQYFENARAQAGRTLNAYQIMSRTSSDMTKAVGDLIANAGGADEVAKLASRIADLDDPEKVNQLVSAARKMSARDVFLYGYYNVILSNIPHVLAKKLTSDVMAATWELGVRAIAARLPGAEVQPGEAMRMAYGYVSSMRDALRLAGRGITTGEHQFEGQASSMDAIGSNRVNVAADGAPEEIGPDQPTRSAIDYLKMALPTRWIGAADDFAKFLHYRADLNAQAFRSGTEKGLTGVDLENHISQIQAAPPADMHDQAVSNSLRTAFQDPLTGVAKTLGDVANAINIPLPGTDFKLPFGRMILPFVKIPANLVGWVYRNSPLAAAFPSDQIKADIAGGGVPRDMAYARMTLGSTVALAASGLAANGLITGRGPNDPGLNRAWRAAGNQPYSITIAGRTYNYSAVDPIGMYIGAIADTFDTMRFAPEQSRYDVAASLGFGLGNALLSKTYMTGLSSFFDALQTPEREGSKYVDKFISSLVAPGAVSGVTDATDPWVRAHYSLRDSIEARIPFLSQKLPPDRTLWGDPIAKQDAFLPPISGTGVARAISPVRYGAPAADAAPIDKWIWDNRMAFPHGDAGELGLAKPGQVQSFPVGKGINVQMQLTPGQLDRFQEQAGNGLKEPSTGMGAKDYLNALVQGNNPDAGAQKQWDNADASLRAMMVQTVVSKMRNAAKRQMLADYPELAEGVRTAGQARVDQLSGANGVRGGASP